MPAVDIVKGPKKDEFATGVVDPQENPVVFHVVIPSQSGCRCEVPVPVRLVFTKRNSVSDSRILFQGHYGNKVVQGHYSFDDESGSMTGV